jgi:peptidoglycan hydrolase-like protein with peptidoglycan-binding domain
MKRITDSLLKRIVRQSLNESYGLLNEEPKVKTYPTGEVEVDGVKYSNLDATQNPCPRGGFCVTPVKNSSYKLANNFIKSSTIPTNPDDQAKWVHSVIALCNNSDYGKGESMDETTINSIVTEIINELDDTAIDEDFIRGKIVSLGDFPSFCVANEYSDRMSSNIFNYKAMNAINGGGGDDNEYKEYIVMPILGLLQNSVNISRKHEVTFLESLSEIAKNKSNEDKTLNDTLLANAKKCGYDTIEAYRVGTDGEAWKCVGRKYTAYTGEGEIGAYQVSFQGYYCIDPKDPKHNPALLVNKPIAIPGGVGYQLDTGNKTIDKFVYGVAKDTRGTDYRDVGVQMDANKVITDFDCDDKKIQFSLSTNAWSYDAALENSNKVFTNVSTGDKHSSYGKIVLTTDPDFNDNEIKDNNLQKESIKGFRHYLLTEEQTLWIGAEDPDVGLIQKALKLRPVDNKFGKNTQKAVIKFQTTEGAKLPTPLRTDGVVDDATLEAIIGTEAFNARNILPASATELPSSETEFTRELTLKSTGPDVVAIQTKLGVSTKGGYGPETQRAVLAFQKKYTDLDDTGIVDEKTFKKIIAAPPAGTPEKYSGRKHNYTTNDLDKWIKVSPNTAENQLIDNNGYFKILGIIDEYSIIIDAVWSSNGGGGSTQKVLFGEDAKQGTDQVISGTGGTGGTGGEEGTGGTGGTGGRGRRSGVVGGGGGGGNVDPERQRQRDLRNKEMCDALRQVKQYLNNTKDAGLTVDCKRDQNTRNQIMMALTGGSSIGGGSSTGGGGAEEPKVSTPGGNVRIY